MEAVTCYDAIWGKGMFGTLITPVCIMKSCGSHICQMEVCGCVGVVGVSFNYTQLKKKTILKLYNYVKAI